MPLNSSLNDAQSLKKHYKDIALDLPLSGEENQKSTPTMNLPLSGEEKSKVNADDERDYKRGHYRYKSKLHTEYTQRSITTN